MGDRVEPGSGGGVGENDLAQGRAVDGAVRGDDARAAWTEALRLSPDNPDVLTNMAISAMTRGDTATAEPLLRRAVAQPGASLKVRLNLAMALGLNGKMVTILPPETPEDQAEIDRPAGVGEIDAAHSFGDQSDKRRQLRLLRTLARRLLTRHL